MTVVINNETYQRTVGTARDTIFRWWKERMVSDVKHRGWGVGGYQPEVKWRSSGSRLTTVSRQVEVAGKVGA